MHWEKLSIGIPLNKDITLLKMNSIIIYSLINDKLSLSCITNNYKI